MKFFCSFLLYKRVQRWNLRIPCDDSTAIINMKFYTHATVYICLAMNFDTHLINIIRKTMRLALFQMCIKMNLMRIHLLEIIARDLFRQHNNNNNSNSKKYQIIVFFTISIVAYQFEAL